eukprot:CAMPEP_0115880240 /NCGR_PEP_ID=MMETSP0287-20121206/27764_1 /TAXON_ID=412157 /ORGANISM="Chrysochromulina rotalis, Strain UIO044" /LENGTH=108 /DNA_ID=CAMNT_0003336035 /DNA_START=29 /DNA_END=355 /DNA_ORIENTATION=+
MARMALNGYMDYEPVLSFPEYTASSAPARSMLERVRASLFSLAASVRDWALASSSMALTSVGIPVAGVVALRARPMGEWCGVVSAQVVGQFAAAATSSSLLLSLSFSE